jgi:hypothetical protein
MKIKLQKISNFIGFYTGKIIMLFLPSILMIMLYHFYIAPKFLFFDDLKHIQNLKNAYISGKLTDEQLQEKFEELNHFSEKLKANEILLKETSILGKGSFYEK